MRNFIKYFILIVVGFACLCVLVCSHFAIAFPVKYLDLVQIHATNNLLDVKMVLSIINVESGFNPKAKSSAGAIGLMQIKPSTANDMAKLDNIVLDEDTLYDPEINICYGCKYIRYLLDYYGDIKLALCAYNAGLGNVNNWLESGKLTHNKGGLIGIPYKETDDYVKKYYKNYKIYTLYNKFGLLKSKD